MAITIHAKDCYFQSDVTDIKAERIYDYLASLHGTNRRTQLRVEPNLVNKMCN